MLSFSIFHAERSISFLDLVSCRSHMSRARSAEVLSLLMFPYALYSFFDFIR